MRDWAGSEALREEAGWRSEVHEAASANAQRNTQGHPDAKLAPQPTESFTALNCSHLPRRPQRRPQSRPLAPSCFR